MWMSAVNTMCACGDSASIPMAPSCACVKPASNTTMRQQAVKVRPNRDVFSYTSETIDPTNPKVRVLLLSKPTCQHCQFGVSVALLAVTDLLKSTGFFRLGLEPLFHSPSTKGA